MQSIAIGRVRTSHGLDGSVKVQSFSGETEHFLRLKSVELRRDERRRTVLVEKTRLLGKVPLLKFEGINGPEEAKLLAGWEMWVDRSQASPCGSGEYYAADLIGLKVRYEGVVIGEITAVFDGPQGSLLELGLDDRKALVPMMSRFVGAVDPGKQELELLVGWILE